MDYTDTLGKSACVDDTLRVIHQIFAEKRKNAKYNTDAGLLTLAVGGGTSLTIYEIIASIGAALGTKPEPNRVILFSQGIMSPGLLITGFGVAKRNRFSKRREDAVVMAYQQGERLPPVTARQLRKQLRNQQ